MNTSTPAIPPGHRQRAVGEAPLPSDKWWRQMWVDHVWVQLDSFGTDVDLLIPVEEGEIIITPIENKEEQQ